MSTHSPPDPQHIAQSLHSAAIHLLRRLRLTDAASGLNSARLSALSVIVFSGPISLGRLAEAEQVRPPTMTRIVNALEARALVTKGSDTNDRRSIRLAATTKGKRLLLAARRHRTRALAQQTASLPPSEQRTLQAAISILNNLTRAL